MMIDLTRFCSKDETRYHHKPWSRGGYTYATEGHIMIRVPRLADVPENPDAPDCNNVFVQAAKVETRTWHMIPPYTLERKPCKNCDGKGYFQKCENCEGSGYVGKNDRDCSDCDGDGFQPCDKIDRGAHPCEDCNGEGLGRPECYVDFMDGEKILARLQGTFLELVKDFPGVQIGIYKVMEPAVIRFEGGEGLLMPVRI